ncbi:TPA: hypothetical protein I8V59_000709 [Corynebacterium striatum]|nr:hypothetical protein [Corynebacterium striatum]
MTNQSPYSQQQEPQKKKPWWKRWWVILIAVLILAGIGNAVTNSENNGADNDKEQTTSEQSPGEDNQEAKSKQEEAQPEEEKKNTVNVADQEWECQPVPDETMQRIMGGDKWDDGAHATVDKAVMVQGADNYFIAANITWEGEDEPFAADFTAPVDGSGPITSASPGTAKLFNWPETPGGPFDGTDAAKECLAQ